MRHLYKKVDGMVYQTGDAKKFFEIRETEEERKLSLILDNAIKKKIETAIVLMTDIMV